MKNERRIPIIGRHPAMTVGLIARLAVRHELAQFRRSWINKINAYLATL